MKINVNGKNFEITEALREKATKKLSKLEKFFNPNTEAQVMMSVEEEQAYSRDYYFLQWSSYESRG